MAFLGLSQWLISEKKICLQWRRCRFDPYVRKIPCRRAQLPTPAVLSGQSHGQRSLAAYSPWGCTESNTTEAIKRARPHGFPTGPVPRVCCCCCCCCCLVAKSYPTLLQPHGLQPTRLLYPWDFPGKNIEVGYHFVLQGIFPTQGSNPHLLDYR